MDTEMRNMECSHVSKTYRSSACVHEVVLEVSKDDEVSRCDVNTILAHTQKTSIYIKHCRLIMSGWQSSETYFMAEMMS